MRFHLCLAVALALLIGLPAPAWADVRLPALLADNLVLQQKTSVALWGWADPGEEMSITASWAKAPVKVIAAADGKWLVRVPTTKAGGPYTLTFQGRNKLTVSNVLLGEVWLCSGQSNMAFPITKRPNSGSYTGVVNAAEVIPKANYPAIRMFTVVNKVADSPLPDAAGKWEVCSPATVGNFSAVAYFFGQEVHEKTGYPIGLINASWGGTPAESWTRKDVLENDPDFRPILTRYEAGLLTYAANQAAYKAELAAYNAERAANPSTSRTAPLEPIGPHSNKSPYKLYNGMINPLLPYTLRGVIWYQGENNTERAYQYRRLFPALIANWRAAWQQPELPFYFVQLAPYRKTNPEIRESQLLTMQTVPHTGMAVITDAGDSLDIHPRNKQVVGHRLALWALSHNYGEKKLPYSGPVYQRMSIEKDKARLHFDHLGGGLVAQGGPLKMFTIAGPDSVFVPAQAIIQGNSVVVWSSRVKQPVAIRFAWNNVPKANFYNAAGLPATPFRTDKWRLETQGKN
jgi:sialate O-acetylesterase